MRVTDFYLALALLFFIAAVFDKKTGEVPPKYFRLGLLLRFAMVTVTTTADLRLSFRHGLLLLVPLFFFVIGYETRRKKEAIGGADFRYFFLAFLFFTFTWDLYLLLFTFAAALLFFLLHPRRKEPFPLLPSMTVALGILLLFGPSLVH